MRKDSVIRAGDLVRVINPIRVVRVGYPRTVKDYLPEIQARYKAELDTVFRSYRKSGYRASRIRERLELDLAYLEAKGDGFGGRQRSLHTREELSLRGQDLRVEAVRTVVTGTYYPATSCPDRYYGGEDHEPGGLASAVHHRLAALEDCRLRPVEEPSRLEIEVCNLEKL